MLQMQKRRLFQVRERASLQGAQIFCVSFIFCLVPSMDELNYRFALLRILVEMQVYHYFTQPSSNF